MELETDVLDELNDGSTAQGKRRLRAPHRSAKARKTVLSFEGAKTDTTEASFLVGSLDGAQRMLHRCALLAVEWTGGSCTCALAARHIEDSVSLALRCLDYYGLIDEATNMPDAETIRLRLMCLGDRIVSALGGKLEAQDTLAGLLFVSLIVLLKTWSDYGIHLILFQWKKSDVNSVADQELRYLTAIRFKTHISYRNVFDFSTRLRLLSMS